MVTSWYKVHSSEHFQETSLHKSYFFTLSSLWFPLSDILDKKIHTSSLSDKSVSARTAEKHHSRWWLSISDYKHPILQVSQKNPYFWNHYTYTLHTYIYSHMTDNKKDALASALAMIEKQFGAGSVMKLGERTHMNVEMTSSGSIALDEALGGGYAKWRIIEIYGPESSGKTTLTLHAIAECQKAGGTAAFVDAEHALDPAYARNIGVDIDNLIVSQPDYGEQALEIVDALVRSGAVDLIVVDSVAALTPKAEIEWNMGDSFMGLQARLMSQALRKVTGVIGKSNTTVIFINQIRMKIGVMFGNPETTTGGNALKFYASQRLEIRKKEKLESGTGDDKEAFGNKVKVKIVKNKVAPPFREVEIDVLFNEWISRAGEVLDIGSDRGIIKKAWAFYSYGDIKLGQWRDNARTFLREDKKLLAKIEAEVRKSKKWDTAGSKKEKIVEEIDE